MCIYKQHHNSIFGIAFICRLFNFQFHDITIQYKLNILLNINLQQQQPATKYINSKQNISFAALIAAAVLLMLYRNVFSYCRVLCLTYTILELPTSVQFKHYDAYTPLVGFYHKIMSRFSVRQIYHNV